MIEGVVVGEDLPAVMMWDIWARLAARNVAPEVREGFRDVAPDKPRCRGPFQQRLKFLVVLLHRCMVQG